MAVEPPAFRLALGQGWDGQKTDQQVIFPPPLPYPHPPGEGRKKISGLRYPCQPLPQRGVHAYTRDLAGHWRRGYAPGPQTSSVDGAELRHQPCQAAQDLGALDLEGRGEQTVLHRPGLQREGQTTDLGMTGEGRQDAADLSLYEWDAIGDSIAQFLDQLTIAKPAKRRDEIKREVESTWR